MWAKGLSLSLAGTLHRVCWWSRAARLRLDTRYYKVTLDDTQSDQLLCLRLAVSRKQPSTPTSHENSPTPRLPLPHGWLTLHAET